MEMPPPARRPIEPANTSTTAIIAAADHGPLHQPVRIASRAEALATYGPAAGSPLGRALADHLANGGVTALAVRTTDVRTALAALTEGERFQLVVVDPASLRAGDLAEVDAICEEQRAFLVAGADPAGMVPPELVATGARNAAVYYPRLLDAHGDLRSPVAAVAGVFARNDHTRGVWKAVAGTSAGVLGAVGVEVPLTDRQLTALSARHVNALRRMPDGTVVLWGDRTVSADPEWKYVNVRRHLLFVEHSIEDGLQWVAAHPNDERLWAAVHQDVTDFLTALWRRHAFPGDKPADAFWVRCDRSTMSVADVTAGRLVLLVGVATVQPGELVTLRVALRAQHGPADPGPVQPGPAQPGPAEARPRESARPPSG